MTLPVMGSFFSFSLLSFPLLSFCSLYATFLLMFLFFLFFCSSFSSLLYATRVLAIDLLLILLSIMSPSFSHLFLSLFFFIFNYFFSSLFCLYSFTTSAHWLGVLFLILYTVSPVLHVLLCLPFDCIWSLLCPFLILDSSFSVLTYVVWFL